MVSLKKLPFTTTIFSTKHLRASQPYFKCLQHCSNIATLRCTKNHPCKLSRVTSPLNSVDESSFKSSFSDRSPGEQSVFWVFCISDAVLGDWESILLDIINPEPHCARLRLEGLAMSLPSGLDTANQTK